MLKELDNDFYIRGGDLLTSTTSTTSFLKAAIHDRAELLVIPEQSVVDQRSERG